MYTRELQPQDCWQAKAKGRAILANYWNIRKFQHALGSQNFNFDLIIYRSLGERDHGQFMNLTVV